MVWAGGDDGEEAGLWMCVCGNIEIIEWSGKGKAVRRERERRNETLLQVVLLYRRQEVKEKRLREGCRLA